MPKVLEGERAYRPIMAPRSGRLDVTSEANLRLCKYSIGTTQWFCFVTGCTFESAGVSFLILHSPPIALPRVAKAKLAPLGRD